MIKRCVLPKKRENEINPNQFVYGTDHFALPFSESELSYLAVGKKKWLTILDKAVHDFKKHNALSELFHQQSALMPFVANVSLLKRSEIIWPKVLPSSMQLYRLELMWTVYLAGRGKTRGNKKPLQWRELFELMKQQNLNYDQMLCHYRAHLMMINLNKRIRIAEQTIKQAGEMVELILQTEPEFEHVPGWVDIYMG